MRKAALVAMLFVLAGGLLAAQQTPPQAPPAQQTPQTQQPPQAQQPPRMPASPPGQTATQVGGKWVTPEGASAPRYTGGKWIIVDYGRPILRSRKNIFGSAGSAPAEAKGAPKSKAAAAPATTPAKYGEQVNAGAPVWRAGANVTTRLRTEVPLVFAGKSLDAGEYSMFVDLDNGKWTLIVSRQPYQQKYDKNNKTDTWGAYNYDVAFDILRAPMTMSKSPTTIDQFTIQFVNMQETGGTLQMLWENTVASVPFKLAQ